MHIRKNSFGIFRTSTMLACGGALAPGTLGTSGTSGTWVTSGTCCSEGALTQAATKTAATNPFWKIQDYTYYYLRRCPRLEQLQNSFFFTFRLLEIFPMIRRVGALTLDLDYYVLFRLTFPSKTLNK